MTDVNDRTYEEIYQDEECCDVRRLHDKFEFPRHNSPRLYEDKDELAARYDFMMEELVEFRHGLYQDDLAEMADALIDLVYVAKGTAVMLGLPWGNLWRDVHARNMMKELGNNERRPDQKYDLVKPEGWLPPNTSGILDDHINREENET